MKGSFYSKDQQAQQLCYTLHPEETADNVSMEMVWHNQKEISFLVPMQFHRENGMLQEFVYNTSNLESLQFYLRHVPINKKKFLELAEKILNALELCSYYMLPVSQICTDMEHIFLDPATMKLQLMCLPLQETELTLNIGQTLESFLDLIYLDNTASQEQPYFQELYDKLLTGSILSCAEARELLGLTEKTEQSDAIPQRRERIVTTNTQSTDATIINITESVGPELSVSKVKTQSTEKKGNVLDSMKSLLNKNADRKNITSAQSIPVADTAAGTMHRTTTKTGRTVCLLHDEPKYLAYLILGEKKYPINAEGCAIGRLGGETEHKIDIYLPSLHVSSYHGTMQYDFEQECYTVTDHSSKGTGIKIGMPNARKKEDYQNIPKNKPIMLKQNDIIVFGDVTARFLVQENAAYGERDEK